MALADQIIGGEEMGMKLYASFNELLLLPLGLPLIRSIFMLSSLHIHT